MQNKRNDEQTGRQWGQHAGGTHVEDMTPPATCRVHDATQGLIDDLLTYTAQRNGPGSDVG